MNRLRKRPGLYPRLQLRDGNERQQGDVRATSLNGIQQRLVFEVADEDMFFVLRQRLIVDTIAGDVDLFRTPEERELFFDQFFEDVIFLLVIACNVDRLAKEHGFLELIVFRL
ncbi:Uncharacterised protein [Salmonella enterica subsp. enterica serovar Typhi]|nr:Uncharacterised protein [Salmonella enterica subsp. enterica serovar Typhi]CQT36164.1 Uncharacterised protein [Salmonella enterica subsp. enterica serovar Typhi]